MNKGRALVYEIAKGNFILGSLTLPMPKGKGIMVLSEAFI